MFTHRFHLDSERLTQKPEKGSTTAGAITNRIVKTVVEIPIEDLAKAVGQNGQSFTPAYFEGRRKNDRWRSQSVFVLDFDKGITFKAVMERLRENGLDCTFAYRTLGATSQLEKFRVIWQLDQCFIDKSARDALQDLLMDFFPGCDKSCKDASRFFYGGKGLLHENYSYVLDMQSFQELARLHCAIKKSKNGNQKRALASFDKKLRVLDVRGLPQNDENTAVAYIYNSDCGNLVNSDYSTKTLPQTLRGVDFKKLSQKVRILHDFMSGKKLSHPVLLGLATNLRWIEGGQKLFNKMIETNPEYDPDKSSIMSYAVSSNYLPQSLKKFSPYESDWCYVNLYQAAKSSTIVRHQEFEGGTLEDTRQSLQGVWKEILQKQKLNLNGFDDAIHVIKAVTGIGKTRLYESLDIPALIALPNHAIKEEIFSKRMKEFVLNTPSMDSLPKEIRERINPLYTIGATSEVNSILKEASETDPIVAEYRTNLFECYQSDSTVLTTHQKAIHISDWTHSLVIFDEDPLAALIPTSTVKYEDLLNLTKVMTEGKIRGQLQALNSQILLNEITLEKNSLLLTPEQQSSLYSTVLDNQQRFTSNILGFLVCDSWTVDPNDAAKIHFISRYELPSNKTTVILSATADEGIYRKLYGDRVRFHDLSNVEPTALIEQNTQHSMSRSSLAKPETLAWAKEKAGTRPVITFSEFKPQFPTAVDELYFGKCTGFDGLKGEDIAVVGTLHLSPTQVALYGAVLGILKSGDNVPKPQRKTINHNGFSFPFTTYDDLKLRDIHLHFVESELRQAIGRARPYSESCRVIVLSNYPLPEAFMVGVDVEKKSTFSATFQGDLGILDKSIDVPTHEPNLLSIQPLHS
jgi:hypothetical protein